MCGASLEDFLFRAAMAVVSRLGAPKNWEHHSPTKKREEHRSSLNIVTRFLATAGLRWYSPRQRSPSPPFLRPAAAADRCRTTLPAVTLEVHRHTDGDAGVRREL